MAGISIQTIFGGVDSSRVVRPIVVSLRRKLDHVEVSSRSADIDRLKLELGVSGELDDFLEDNGCSGFRVVKAKRFASAKITMHSDIWRKGAEHAQRFLEQQIETCVRELAERIDAAELQIQGDALVSDVRSALR